MTIKTSKDSIVLDRLRHRSLDCIAIRFPYDAEVVKIVKQVPNVKFSKTHKCWYVAGPSELGASICNVFLRYKLEVDQSRLNIHVRSGIPTADRTTGGHQQALRMMEQKLHLKGYSAQTVKTYLSQFWIVSQVLW